MTAKASRGKARPAIAPIAKRLELPSQSSAQEIFRDIVKGLYEGRFVPGQRLVEADLTRIYGVGRGSVREALNRLAAERIVALNLHRGAQIRSLTRAEVRDILVLLEPMIGLAARLAARSIDVANARDRFGVVFDQLMSFEPRPDSFDLVRARNAFYRTLVEMGGNQELARVLPGMHVHLLRVQFRAFQPSFESERFSDYRSIGEAVLAGDVKRAELAGRRHVTRIATVLEGLPDHAFGTER